MTSRISSRAVPAAVRRGGSSMVAMLTALLLTMGLCMVTPAGAVQPDEVLTDPKLEARARALSRDLRCMVCQNQSIDDSDAPLARDLRLLVRERISAGDSDHKVMDFLVARYGEFVLLRPRMSWHTAALWGAPVVVLLFGGLAIFVAVRRRPTAATQTAGLAPEEERRLQDLTDGADRGG